MTRESLEAMAMPIDAPNEAAKPENLAGSVARGASWIVAARLVSSALGLVSSIIVARLLAPADFGLVAIAVTAMQLLLGVTDFGVAQAVVKFRDAGRADLDTLFTFSALRGLALALLLAGAGPVAAAFYGDPRLVAVFFAVAFAAFLLGLINPRFYEFERSLDFSKEFAWTVAAKLAGVAASVAVAVAFGSYWAILAGIVAGAAMQLLLSYAMRPHLPRVAFSSFRRLVGFSGWLAGVSFLAALNNKLDVFILARAAGPAATGAFFYGAQLAELPTREIAGPIARALYPGFSALQADRPRMTAAYLSGVEALAALALPASIGFAFIARDLVVFLLGAKWLEAGMVIEIVAPALGLQTLFLATQSYASALGAPKLVFHRELVFFLVRTPIFVWAASVHGLAGAAAALAGYGVLHAVLNLWLFARASGGSPLAPLLAARRSLLASAVMAAGLWLAQTQSFSGLSGVAIEISAGIAIYGVALALLWRLEGAPMGVERRAVAFARRRFAGA